MSRGEACTAAGSQAEARTRSDDWTIIAEQAYEAGTLRPLAYRLGFCERTIVEREAELVALQDGSLTIKHPIRRANRLQSEIESSKREIVSIREQLLKPRPDVSERLAAERADLAKFEAELTALRASIGERTPTLAERHEIAGVENRLFYADANIAKLATHPHVPPHHPQTPSLVTMQELVLAHVEGVNAELVTQGTNRRGTPRVQFSSPHARYSALSKLTAVEAREFGQGLLDGADLLDAEPPVPAEGSTGPQSWTLANSRDAYAELIEKGSNNRGKRRVSLHLKGCRYPISLTGEQARALGNGMVDGAALLDTNA
jgi:hypothetical protein